MKDCNKGNCCAHLKMMGNTLGLFLALNYTFCVLFCLLFDNEMYMLWQGWLPKFEWLSLKSYFIGLVETFAYGWYFAIILGVACRLATCCCAGKSACSTDKSCDVTSNNTETHYGSCGKR